MTCPLQRISMSDREKISIYQTYMRKSIAVIHQQKERVFPPRASPFKDFAPRKNDGNQSEDWTRKSHILLPNYLLDHINLIRQNRKRIYESCTINESYPALQKTETNDTTSLEQYLKKILFAYACESIPLYENQKLLYLWLCRVRSVLGYSNSNAMTSSCLLGKQFQFQNNQLPIQMLGFHRQQSAETIDLVNQISFMEPLLMQLPLRQKEKTTVSSVPII